VAPEEGVSPNSRTDTGSGVAMRTYPITGFSA
jgi:hypothetical protein